MVESHRSGGLPDAYGRHYVPMLDPALLDRLLRTALERGGDYADVYVQRIRERSLVMEEGRLKSASESTACGVGIRVQRGEATGFAVCEDLDEAALQRAARRAAAIADGGPVAPAALRALALPERYPQRRPLADAALDERIALVRRLAERAAADPAVAWVQAALSDRDDTVQIATSDGVLAHDRRPLLQIRVRVQGERDGRRESVYDTTGGRCGLEHLDDARIDGLAARVQARLATRLAAAEAPAGTMPVMIAPGVGGVMLHEAVGHGLEADFNRKGTSTYSGKIGSVVASPLVRVVDRGDLPGEHGALAVDDEGVIPGCTPLIEGGVLTGYLHDRLSARLMGCAPTGNGRRQSYHHLPMPRMRCTLLEAGPHDPEEILRSVSKGLFVTWIGGGSVDIAKGDFNFNVEEAFLIEDGRLTRPVRGACLIGNGPEVMRQITMLGSDARIDGGIGMCGKNGQSVPVSDGCPTTLIASMVVGGRS